MNLKSIIALFLGLVIQFSQVLAMSTSDFSSPCGEGGAMSCCDRQESCPCVSSGNPDQTPPPLAPAAVEMKWFVAKRVDPEPSVVRSVVSGETLVTALWAELKCAYAGVPLCVAFCRLII
jgi:hypothetical protein